MLVVAEPHKLLVVSYHSVGPLDADPLRTAGSFPLERFRSEMAWLAAHYVCVRLKDLLEPYEGRRPRALLTFDDGYRDHIRYVLPVLEALSLTGAFFVCAQPVLERRVLDAHKIQLVLAAGCTPKQAVEVIRELFLEDQGAAGQEAFEHLQAQIRTCHQFDVEEVAVVKKLLQTSLPTPLRHRALELLWRRFMDMPEAEVCRDLYMDEGELKQLRVRGMSLGLHGRTHQRLSALSAADQRRELQTSRDFVLDIGGETAPLAISYPYGDCDETSPALCAEFGISAGFTTRRALADLRTDDPLLLPRFDCRDLAGLMGV